MMQRTPELLRVLLDAGVEFILIGGVAAIAHGSASFTRDCDIAAPLTEANLERLLLALSPYTPRYAMTVDKRPVTQTASELRGLRNLYLLTDLGRLDVLGEIAPIGDFGALAVNAIEVDLYGRRCRVIGLDDLIAVKQHLGREKDVVVERELRVLRERRSKDE